MSAHDLAIEAAADFQQQLGYTFRDLGLLERALTHKSFSNENREVRAPNNERLEFLGDAVLGFVVGELIYRSFPNLQEGALSKIKAHLVSATMLSAKARALGIGRFLRMGAGEARSGGAEKLSLLADAFEAVVAAIYLDGGLPATEGVPAPHLRVRRSPGSTSATSPSTTTRRRCRRRPRAWAFRFRTTGSSRSPAPTTKRPSSSSSPGTARPSPAAAAPPSAKPSARPPRKPSRNSAGSRRRARSRRE